MKFLRIVVLTFCLTGIGVSHLDAAAQQSDENVEHILEQLNQALIADRYEAIRQERSNRETKVMAYVGLPLIACCALGLQLLKYIKPRCDGSILLWFSMLFQLAHYGCNRISGGTPRDQKLALAAFSVLICGVLISHLPEQLCGTLISQLPNQLSFSPRRHCECSDSAAMLAIPSNLSLFATSRRHGLKYERAIIFLLRALSSLCIVVCGVELACTDTNNAQTILSYYAPGICAESLSQEELRTLKIALLNFIRHVVDIAEPRNQFSQIQHKLYQALHNMDIEGLEQSLATTIEEAALAIQDDSPIHYASLSVGIEHLNGYLLEGNEIHEQTPPHTGIELLDQQIITLGHAINRVSSALLLKTQGVE